MLLKTGTPNKVDLFFSTNRFYQLAILHQGGLVLDFSRGEPCFDLIGGKLLKHGIGKPIVSSEPDLSAFAIS